MSAAKNAVTIASIPLLAVAVLALAQASSAALGEHPATTVAGSAGALRQQVSAIGVRLAPSTGGSLSDRLVAQGSRRTVAVIRAFCTTPTTGRDSSPGRRPGIAAELTSLTTRTVSVTAGTSASSQAQPKRRTSPTPSPSPSSASPKPTPTPTAMPTTNPAGWKQVFSDDFNGTSLNTSKWFSYGTAQPGGDPGVYFSASHVTVANGMLDISTYKDAANGGAWTSGGIQQVRPPYANWDQTYGKYLVRMKCQAADGVSDIVLLIPADGSWPPELDFVENNGGAKQTNYATLHYGSASSYSSIYKQDAVDMTQWHTYGVEWTPGQLVYTLDGRDWATVYDPNVPAISMGLCIQSQAWLPGVSTWETPVDSTTPSLVNLHVDWAVAYAPA